MNALCDSFTFQKSTELCKFKMNAICDNYSNKTYIKTNNDPFTNHQSRIQKIFFEHAEQQKKEDEKHFDYVARLLKNLYLSEIQYNTKLLNMSNSRIC